jgi:L-seryl-tRNA(Ser) seleniumtransferase
MMNEDPTARELRKLPSVSYLLQSPEIETLLTDFGRDLVVDAIRDVLDQARQTIVSGGERPPAAEVARQIGLAVNGWVRPSLQPVINATGVVIHTNLGRAPLSARARQAMEQVARGYSNLEYDLDEGQRGSRYVHAEAMLKRLTGAEGALVVNNNAGAVLLILSAFANGKEVVISRGQLVEIGGGFRVPDVMKQSGVRLVEVGATNRTHVRDYEEAIHADTVALMRVHHSNFRMIGFTQDVCLMDMVIIARKHNCLVFDDLGSGTLLDTSQLHLKHEPTVQESVASGADLVSFSGDKLLGGPQVGIIVGGASKIETLRQHPLTRALRVDKIALAGLQATLLHYIEGRAMSEVPVWRMMGFSTVALRSRAERWRAALADGCSGLRAEVTEGESAVGGGSLPGETLPTVLLALDVPSAEAFGYRLRKGNPPVVGRIENGRFLLDPRTVPEEDEDALLQALAAAGPMR